MDPSGRFQRGEPTPPRIEVSATTTMLLVSIRKGEDDMPSALLLLGLAPVVPDAAAVAMGVTHAWLDGSALTVGSSVARWIIRAAAS